MSEPTAETSKLPDDLEEVRRSLVAAAERGQLDVAIGAILSLLEQTREQNNQLRSRLEFALRQLFGRKSQAVSSGQLKLTLEELGLEGAGPASEPAKDEPVAQPPLPGDDEEAAAGPDEGKKKSRKRGKRKPLPAHLPRTRERLPLPDALRPCPQCDTLRVTIAWRESAEVLEFVPASFRVIIEERETVLCPKCNVNTSMDRADSEKVMPRGRPGPGLLAQLVVDKLDNAMPLERQRKEYARYGVALATSTMGDWAAYALDCLVPLYEVAITALKQSPVMNVDDTGLLALDKRHPEHVHKGHLWVHVGSDLAVFHYALTWKAPEFARFLAGYRGIVQGDGYRGYEAKLESADDDDALEKVVPEARRLGCLMHLRAKFERAYEAGDKLAALPLSLIGKIYDLEKQAKALSVGLAATPPGRLYLPKPVDAELRHGMRQAASVPLWEELMTYVEERTPKTRPKSDLGRALTYARNQRERIARCFSDGRYELDNGVAERVVRLACLGRKNFLFAGSPAAGQRLAVGYTLVASARMHGLDPYAYLRDVLIRLRQGCRQSELRGLLPDRWATRASAEQSDAHPPPRADG